MRKGLINVSELKIRFSFGCENLAINSRSSSDFITQVRAYTTNPSTNLFEFQGETEPVQTSSNFEFAKNLHFYAHHDQDLKFEVRLNLK